jgi:2-oxoglutarate ferredoxin oxidoreductase subunit beta
MYDPNYLKFPPALQPLEKDGKSVIDFYKLMADRIF